MTAGLVDTNVLVSFFLNRNAEQQRLAFSLFEAANAGTVTLLIPQVALTDMVFVLTGLYERDPREAREMLHDLLSHPGVAPVDQLSWPRLMELWPKELPDFADAVLATIAEELAVPAVATFDKPLIRKLKKLGLRGYWS